jgi:hypothetical protein
MKNLKLKLISTIITAVIVLSSCGKEDSADVNQDKIYAEYELFYDKNNDKTYASAVFKFSNVTGTNLQLTAPSEIKFNGDVIPYDATFAYYRKEYAGIINSGTFTFKDTDGLTYTNPVSLAKIITNPVIDTIKRANGAYTYTWVGDSVRQNELIGLTIGSVANPLDLEVFLQGAVSSKNFVLPLTQLNGLAIGNSYCQLDRQVETNAPSVTSAGGKIRGKYRAQNTTLYVK